MAISINYFSQLMILRKRCNTENCTLTHKDFQGVFYIYATKSNQNTNKRCLKQCMYAQNHNYAALNVYLDRNELKNTSQPTLKCYNNVLLTYKIRSGSTYIKDKCQL